MKQQSISLIPERPTLSGAIVVRGGQAECRTSEGVFRVRAPGRMLGKLATLCDGEHGRDEVIGILSSEWCEDDVRGLMEGLVETGLLQEATDRTSDIWRLVSNPQQYGEPPAGDKVAALVRAARERLSERGELSYRSAERHDFSLRHTLEKRRSVRTFADSAVAQGKILALLWAAYGAVAAGEEPARRTVPSGGALYPLDLYYCNLRRSSDLDAGIYAVEYRYDGQVGLRSCSIDIASFAAALTDPDALTYAQGVLVIGGRFSWSAQKYGNRALSLVTLEAGHAAQNALLAAADLDLAAHEVTGFTEHVLGRTLDLPQGVTPLTTIIFGAMPSSSDLDAHKRARSPGVEFQWAEPEVESYRVAFHLGTARVGDDEWSLGMDVSARVAHDKAIAEAWERRTWREPTGLTTARHGELPQAIDPSGLVQFEDWQYDAPHFPFQKFDRQTVRLWVELEKIGQLNEAAHNAWVPAEFVFLATKLSYPEGTKPLARASTSGMAAFPTLDGAIERGLLELVERDALMIAWLTRRPAPTIDQASLPQALRSRVDALARAGVRIVLKDISADSVPVVLAFGQHAGRCFTIVKTAAAFSAEAAAGHALAELEARVLSALPRDGRPTPTPQSVVSPQDHFNLYAQPRYFRRADWLAAPGKTTSLRKVEQDRPGTVERLLATLGELGHQAFCYCFSSHHASLHQGRTPLHVVRVLVPGLVPVNFMYGTEALGMPRLDRFGGAWRPIRKRAVFPHPFD